MTYLIDLCVLNILIVTVHCHSYAFKYVYCNTGNPYRLVYICNAVNVTETMDSVQETNKGP